MARQITEYDLLISCPSDVKDELNIIIETVDTFNRLFGEMNNAKIVTKHWSKDSYPKSGGKPQKLLNEQFVLKCDTAVAVFWTRFGTPTDEYSSGTEEEIEELIKNGKQVFLYFSDCPVVPSKVDNAQYEKVKAFRERYKDRGLYGTYADHDTFKKDFLNHLTLHFINLLEGNRIQSKPILRSSLTVKGVNNEKIKDNAIAFRTNYSNCKYIKEIREKAISLVNQVNNIILTIQAPSDEAHRIINDNKNEKEFPNLSVGEMNKLSKSDLSELSKHFLGLKELYPVQPVVINNKWKQKIDKFSNENNLKLNSNFYNLGTLSKQGNNYLIGILGTSNQYNGTDEEKSKYNLICKLDDLLDEYYESVKYFSTIDSLSFICLALCNNGKDYDEDIDIKLYIKKDYLCYPEDLPLPGFECMNIGIESFEYIYKAQKTVNIDEYPDYYIKPYIPKVPSLHIGLMGGKSYEEELKEKTKELNEEKEKIFCYQYFDDEELDILRYNQTYLKQNTNSFLPSYLVFNKLPEKIRFEITSKRYPDVVKGELVLKEFE